MSFAPLIFNLHPSPFYLDHHNGRVNRNKIRFREYVGSGLTFLEIKLKNNKGKTIKKRIKVDSIPEVLSDKQQKYIDKIVGNKLEVSAKQWIDFSRVTFVHNTHLERLTLDVNLTFKNKIKDDYWVHNYYKNNIVRSQLIKRFKTINFEYYD